MGELGRRHLRYRRYAREIREQLADGASGGRPHSNRSSVQLRIPSADEALHFGVNVTFSGRWEGAAPAPPTLLEIAEAGIARRAERISVGYRLTASSRVKTELNATLVNWEPVTGTHASAWGHCESIEVDPELLTAVEEHEEAVRRQAVMSWDVERRRQQAEQMSSVILDPLRATAWWMLDNQDKPLEAVEVAQQFQRLRTVLEPEEQPDSAGTLVDQLLATADGAVRNRMMSILRNSFHEYQRDDLAARLDSQAR